MPKASRAITHSAVSAAVTQSLVDTHRTPNPFMTKVSQCSAIRSLPTVPSTAPDSIG
jgi:hypothetical protein